MSAPLQPSSDDVDAAMAHLALVDRVGLARDDGPRCRSCRFYLDPEQDLSWCWHPDLRIAVDAAWGCQEHTPPP